MKRKLKQIFMDPNAKVLLVTHDGVFHTDDVMSTAVLEMLLERNKVGFNILRTRSQSEYSDWKYSDVIEYDVFGGELDHHQKETTVQDGRPLSAIGLIWRWAKKEIIETFGIDEKSWKSVDENLLKPIDQTDNSGNMNPFNWTLNAVRTAEIENSCGDYDRAFDKVLSEVKSIFERVLQSERKACKDRKAFDELPVKTINNLKWKINCDATRFIPISYLGKGVEGGYIWKNERGNWMVRRPQGVSLKQSDKPGVVFVHKSGFIGEIESLDLLSEIL